MGKDWYKGCTSSRIWRLNHLYFINSKSDGVIRFKLNWAQEELVTHLWTRNQILKARQLGLSTVVQLLMLDSCLFNENFRAGIIDKTINDAEEKLHRLKQTYQWMLEAPSYTRKDHVEDPEDREEIRKYAKTFACGGEKLTDKAAEISVQKADFANGSQIRIGVNLRGSSLNLLHVSEFGYVSHNFPKRAIDIIQGGLNTVPKDQIIIMESTHEGGKYGENYRMVKQAMEAQNRRLDFTDYKFFFFPWHKQEEYSLPDSKLDTSELLDYWQELEAAGCHLSDAQKRWYLSQSRIFGALIKREYPSTPEEALSNPASGAIYGKQMDALRAAGKLAAVFEADDEHPLYISWDLGSKDATAMWLFQPGGDGRFYVLDYYAAARQRLQHYLDVSRKWEGKYGQMVRRHILPHDARQVKLGQELSVEAQLNKADCQTVVLPVTNDIWTGIYAVRDLIGHCVFHERCGREIVVDSEVYMSGIDALENYKTGGVGASGVERSEPLHDACSHGADAFRYFAEALALGVISRTGVRAPELKHQSWNTSTDTRLARAKGTPSWW